ncbi:MAG: hypothetical protein II271_03130, partial [Muribaculaceae bacterium]|nr:hypothetical protein [Muribaculaceae bacterium]
FALFAIVVHGDACQFHNVFLSLFHVSDAFFGGLTAFMLLCGDLFLRREKPTDVDLSPIVVCG